MEINRIIANQQANFWQWTGVDYPVFCQTEPICSFTDTQQNIIQSGYTPALDTSCPAEIGDYCYPFKAGDEFSFTVPIDAIGDTQQSYIRLGISSYGIPLYLDVAAIEFVGNFIWFSGTLPAGLENNKYEFIIYSDTGENVLLDIIAKTNNITDEDCLGSFEAQASGGLPPYQYSLDGVSYQDSGLFDNLCNGVYTVWVKDANCQGNVLSIQIRTFPGCEFFEGKTIGYLCENGWTPIDLCGCPINC